MNPDSANKQATLSNSPVQQKSMRHKNNYLWQDCDGISPTSTRNVLHYWVGEYLACAYCMGYSLYACKGILWTAVQTRVSGTCVSRIVNKKYLIEAETKWISFCRQYFSINFLVWKLLYFNWNFTEIRSLSSSWELISFGSNLGSNQTTSHHR